MKQRSIRVLLASEYPERRSFLKEMIEARGKAVIVGQAENASRALTLAKNLRPNVAVIDSYLPHMVGLDDVPLSRVGGLDTAQAISSEIPNIRVVLLNSLESGVPSESRRSAFFCKESKEACIPFTVDELQVDEVPPSGTLVFAHVVAKARATPGRETISRVSDKAILFGVIGIVGGATLVITLFLSGAGVYLALAGMATLTAGLTGKLVSRILK